MKKDLFIDQIAEIGWDHNQKLWNDTVGFNENCSLLKMAAGSGDDPRETPEGLGGTRS